MFTTSVLVVALALGTLMDPSAATAAPAEGLGFVGPPTLTLTEVPGTSDTKTFSVWLGNNSGSPVKPRFTTQLVDQDGKQVTASVEPSTISPIPAYMIERITLTITGITKLAGSSGQIVASSATVPPATLQLSIEPKATYKASSQFVLISSALVAALLVGLFTVGLRFAGNNLRFRATLRPEDLEFSSGFASGLTLVGALLGTIVSAGVIPEHTEWLSKNTYVALNLIFTGLTAVAALVYTAFQTEEDNKVHGRVWAFTVAAGLTAWAAFGELTTIWLLIWDINASSGLTQLGTAIIQIVLAASGLLMGIYLVTSIYRITGQDPTGDPDHPLKRKTRIRSRSGVKRGLL